MQYSAKSLLLELTFSILLLLLLSTLTIYSSHAQTTESFSSPECITYDSEEKVITIICKSATLTDINNQLKDPDVLHKETTNGVWLLNAGIIIEQDATLYINSTDTSWLKINADGETADSVKVTSWNPETNDYVKFEVEKEDGAKGADYAKKLRPFIRVDEKSTSSTEITNSEIAYLGYLSKAIMVMVLHFLVVTKIY